MVGVPLVLVYRLRIPALFTRHRPGRAVPVAVDGLLGRFLSRRRLRPYVERVARRLGDLSTEVREGACPEGEGIGCAAGGSKRTRWRLDVVERVSRTVRRAFTAESLGGGGETSTYGASVILTRSWRGKGELVGTIKKSKVSSCDAAEPSGKGEHTWSDESTDYPFRLFERMTRQAALAGLVWGGIIYRPPRRSVPNFPICRILKKGAAVANPINGIQLRRKREYNCLTV